jgi:hypothetical protein
MIKPDLLSPPLEYPTLTGEFISVPQHSPQPQEKAQRLIVLIPADLDYTWVTRQIWELANAAHPRVQLLGISKAASDEPGMRRQLATVAALIHHGHVSVEVKVESRTSWLQAVRANYQPGDTIVCFAEHRGFLHKPMHQILETNLDASIYVLSEPQSQKSEPKRFSQVLGWSGSIAIILAFGVVQARISRLPEDWFQSVLFILSILVEFRLIWTWSSLHD